ncbi:hypothetical protein GCM10010246_04410 [Streptomyces cuspidosporus]|uniref:Uncharacterized protein n=1 Tax=Streptomyces cuspidosporus TaxID=66882 RepID=A0ABP5SAM8_9ACTN
MRAHSRRPASAALPGADRFRAQARLCCYKAEWKQWEQFCSLLELPVSPITPGSLTAFVEWPWWQPGWKKGTCAAPTIDRRPSGVVVSGRTEHKLKLGKTVAARARRVLKAKAMEKTSDPRPGTGPRPARRAPAHCGARRPRHPAGPVIRVPAGLLAVSLAFRAGRPVAEDGCVHLVVRVPARPESRQPAPPRCTTRRHQRMHHTPPPA